MVLKVATFAPFVPLGWTHTHPELGHAEGHGALPTRRASGLDHYGHYGPKVTIAELVSLF